MDFTPGVLDLKLSSAPGESRPEWAARVRTTLAKQLALYVVIHSPVQMAADLVENYDPADPAFRFIRDVPVDWGDTRVLAGEIGDYVVVARRERDSDTWWVGAISDEQARQVTVDLSFLQAPGGAEPTRSGAAAGRAGAGGSPGAAAPVGWTATVWADGPGAHWRDAPFDMEVSERTVTPDQALTLRLAPGGGQALRLRPTARSPRR
jgi:alpha-glucosidase